MRGPLAHDITEGYARYIDVDSFIDGLLINECSNNVDAYNWSCYFHKDRDSRGGRLRMGPPWDYSDAFGNAHERGGRYADGWRIHRNRVPFWWKVLLDDTVFTARLRARWEDLRSTVLQEGRVRHWIDSVTTRIRPALERNHSIWRSFDTYIWMDAWRARSVDEEASFFATWFVDRLRWMDAELPHIAHWTPTQERCSLHSMEAVYPQPARGRLTVTFSLGMYGSVDLLMFDMLGREEGRWPLGIRSIGSHAVEMPFDVACDGMYVLRMDVGGIPADFRVVHLRE